MVKGRVIRIHIYSFFPQIGVKELNIAASLEHLRDQRMGTVKNEQQFKCVFSCVADEISSMLKGLQH
jgi:protein tyrosine phosphatase